MEILQNSTGLRTHCYTFYDKASSRKMYYTISLYFKPVAVKVQNNKLIVGYVLEDILCQFGLLFDSLS